MAKKKRRRFSKSGRPGGMFWVCMVLLMLLVVVVFNGIRLRSRLAEYEKQEADLKQQIEMEEKRKEEIEEYRKYTQTNKFKSEYAQEKWDYVHPNEILFQVED